MSWKANCQLLQGRRTLLTWLLVLGITVQVRALQGQAESPKPTKSSQGSGQSTGIPKEPDIQDPAGRALKRFLEGKKAPNATKEPTGGKSPEKSGTEKGTETPKAAAGEGSKTGKPTEDQPSSQDESKQDKPGGPAGGRAKQEKATTEGLEKFLHSKPKGGETGKGGPDEGPLLPEPFQLSHGLPENELFLLHGNLTSWYRYRRSEDDQDSKLIGLLALDFGDADRDPWSVHFLGRGAWDMDGNHPGNVFNGILETYPNTVTGRIYSLYVQARDLGPFAFMRLGRQEILETPQRAWIDGFRFQTVDSGRGRVRLGGYIGRATRIFALSEDALSAGASLESMPWEQGRIRLDWMYVDQEQPSPELEDQLFGVTWWQGIGENNQLYTKATMLEDRGRDFILRDTAFIADWGLQITASYFELMTTQRYNVVEFDLFAEAAFEYKPYRQVQLHLDQEISDIVNLNGGVDLRRLKHSSDEGRFNREYDRYFLSGSVGELFDETTTFNVTWDRFDSGGEDIDEVSADVRCRFAPDWVAQVGSSYSLFKFDWTTSDEKEHVRTYDASLTWRPNPGLRFRLVYLLENDDIGRFHSVRASLSWDF